MLIFLMMIFFLYFFKGFCDQIGVSNIRQYEERELKSQQDREKKKMEHENQINRISNQLEYERKREEQVSSLFVCLHFFCQLFVYISYVSCLFTF